MSSKHASVAAEPDEVVEEEEVGVLLNTTAEDEEDGGGADHFSDVEEVESPESPKPAAARPRSATSAVSANGVQPEVNPAGLVDQRRASQPGLYGPLRASFTFGSMIGQTPKGSDFYKTNTFGKVASGTQPAKRGYSAPIGRSRATSAPPARLSSVQRRLQLLRVKYAKYNKLLRQKHGEARLASFNLRDRLQHRAHIHQSQLHIQAQVDPLLKLVLRFQADVRAAVSHEQEAEASKTSVIEALAEVQQELSKVETELQGASAHVLPPSHQLKPPRNEQEVAGLLVLDDYRDPAPLADMDTTDMTKEQVADGMRKRHQIVSDRKKRLKAMEARAQRLQMYLKDVDREASKLATTTSELTVLCENARVCLGIKRSEFESIIQGKIVPVSQSSMHDTHASSTADFMAMTTSTGTTEETEQKEAFDYGRQASMKSLPGMSRSSSVVSDYQQSVASVDSGLAGRPLSQEEIKEVMTRITHLARDAAQGRFRAGPPQLVAAVEGKINKLLEIAAALSGLLLRASKATAQQLGVSGPAEHEAWHNVSLVMSNLVGDIQQHNKLLMYDNVELKSKVVDIEAQLRRAEALVLFYIARCSHLEQRVLLPQYHQRRQAELRVSSLLATNEELANDLRKSKLETETANKKASFYKERCAYLESLLLGPSAGSSDAAEAKGASDSSATVTRATLAQNKEQDTDPKLQGQLKDAVKLVLHEKRRRHRAERELDKLYQYIEYLRRQLHSKRDRLQAAVAARLDAEHNLHSHLEKLVGSSATVARGASATDTSSLLALSARFAPGGSLLNPADSMSLVDHVYGFAAPNSKSTSKRGGSHSVVPKLPVPRPLEQVDSIPELKTADDGKGVDLAASLTGVRSSASSRSAPTSPRWFYPARSSSPPPGKSRGYSATQQRYRASSAAADSSDLEQSLERERTAHKNTTSKLYATAKELQSCQRERLRLQEQLRHAQRQARSLVHSTPPAQGKSASAPPDQSKSASAPAVQSNSLAVPDAAEAAVSDVSDDDSEYEI